MSARRALPLVALLLALAPDAAWACAVCFDPNEEPRLAFLGTTALLSLLPLGLVAGTAWWFWRQAKLAGRLPAPEHR